LHRAVDGYITKYQFSIDAAYPSFNHTIFGQSLTITVVNALDFACSLTAKNLKMFSKDMLPTIIASGASIPANPTSALADSAAKTLILSALSLLKNATIETYK
jgi:hypothetical protein